MLQRTSNITYCKSRFVQPLFNSLHAHSFSPGQWVPSPTLNCALSINTGMEKEDSRLKSVIVPATDSLSSGHSSHRKSKFPKKDRPDPSTADSQDKQHKSNKQSEQKSHHPHRHYHHHQSHHYHHDNQYQHARKNREERPEGGDPIVQHVRSVQKEIRRVRVRSVVSGLVDPETEELLTARSDRSVELSVDTMKTKKRHRKERSRKDSYPRESNKLPRNNYEFEWKPMKIMVTEENPKKGQTSPAQLSFDSKNVENSQIKHAENEALLIPIVEQLFKSHTTRTSLNLALGESSMRTIHPTVSAEMATESSLFTDNQSESRENWRETGTNKKFNKILKKTLDSELEEGEIVDSDTRSPNTSEIKIKRHKKHRPRKYDNTSASVSDLSFNRSNEEPAVSASAKLTSLSREHSHTQKISQKHEKAFPFGNKRRQVEASMDKAMKTKENECNTSSGLVSQKSAPVTYLSKAVQHDLNVKEGQQKFTENVDLLEEGEVATSASDTDFPRQPCLPLSRETVSCLSSSDMSISSEEESNRDFTNESTDSNVMIVERIRCDDNRQPKKAFLEYSCERVSSQYNRTQCEKLDVKLAPESRKSFPSKDVTMPVSALRAEAPLWNPPTTLTLGGSTSTLSDSIKDQACQPCKASQNLASFDSSKEQDSIASPWSAEDRVQKWPTIAQQQPVTSPSMSTGFVKGSVFMETLSMMNHSSAGVAQKPHYPVLSYSSVLQQAFQSQIGNSTQYQTQFLSCQSSSNYTSSYTATQDNLSQSAFINQHWGSRGFSTKSSHKGSKADWFVSRCQEISGTPRCWQTLRKADKSEGSMNFTVMSYNILAQELLQRHPDLYSKCRFEDLEWSNRGQALMTQIVAHNADIVCLQEVQEDHWMLEMKDVFAKHGYQSVFKKKIGDKPDGCAILYKRDKFRELEVVAIDFMKGGRLDRDNVGVIVLLQPLPEVYGGKVQKICVATTHLLFNPKRGDIKLAQLMVLLAEIDKYAHIGDASHDDENKLATECPESNQFSEGEISDTSESTEGMDKRGEVWEGVEDADTTRKENKLSSEGSDNPGSSSTTSADGTTPKTRHKNALPLYCPIILCGDFNSEPFSEMYQFITSGYLKYVSLIPRLLCGQKEGKFGGNDRTVGKQLLPKHLAIGERCQYLDVVEQRQKRKGWNVQKPKLNTGEIFHEMNFQSIYSHLTDGPGPRVREVSTHHNRSSCTVDYIFYSSGTDRRGKRKTIDTLFDHVESRKTDASESGQSDGRGRFGSPSSFHKPETGDPGSVGFEGQWEDKHIDAKCSTNTGQKEAACNDEPLQLLARYRLLTLREISKIGYMPNSTFPSDHLCLIAKFLLK